jgi:putative acetyltransferase
MENWLIRKIEKKDNAAVARLIRAVFDELNIPKEELLTKIPIWT